MKEIPHAQAVDVRHTDPLDAATAAHLDALLEEALMDTFPASDPISFSSFRDQ